jgi:peptidoglycan-associated lipoprotein
MKKALYLSLILTTGLLLIYSGCQKKTTKIPDQAPPPMEQPQPPEEEPQQEEEMAEKPEEPAEPAIPLEFEKVYFEFDKYSLQPAQRDNLSQNARVLKAYPDVKLLIEGHCDERGTIEYNLALGEKRASTVKEYLVNYGISPDRLSTISYGEQRPANPGKSEKAYALNRRAEFTVTQK